MSYFEETIRKDVHKENMERLAYGTASGISTGLVGGILGPTSLVLLLAVYLGFEGIWTISDYFKGNLSRYREVNNKS